MIVRLIHLAAIIVVALMLAACGGGDDSENEGRGHAPEALVQAAEEEAERRAAEEAERLEAEQRAAQAEKDRMNRIDAARQAIAIAETVAAAQDAYDAVKNEATVTESVALMQAVENRAATLETMQRVAAQKTALATAAANVDAAVFDLTTAAGITAAEAALDVLRMALAAAVDVSEADRAAYRLQLDADSAVVIAARLEAERLESTIRVVDEYICTDEYDRAVDYAIRNVPGAAAVPVLWDGMPFVVDISSVFTNAHELLDAVADEAEWIEAVLGYEVFVAGDVLPLGEIEESELYYFDSGRQLIPPHQRIHVRCCYDDPTGAGSAYPWWRVMILEYDDFQSRHIILHELYHILGFGHPDEEWVVTMSDALMYGPGFTPLGASIPTAADTSDLAKLACIYDEGVGDLDLMAVR